MSNLFGLDKTRIIGGMPTRKRTTDPTHPTPGPAPQRSPQVRAPTAADDTITRRGIQSIEVGGALLRALAHQGRALPLKDLAAEAGMTPAKAHPYLVSFGKLGLVTQHAGSGHYGLGPLAMQLGLISLQQLDPLALATARLEALAQEIGHTVAVAVWGNRGPTIVRVARAPSAVHVNMRHGTVMSVRGTASGRLWAAWLPQDRVAPLLESGPAPAQTATAAKRPDSSKPPAAPQARKSRPPPGDPAPADTAEATPAAWAAALSAIRAEGLSRVRDRLLPGVSALAVPVFDGPGRMVLALTTIGTSATLDTGPQGLPARALLRTAQALSAQLGGAATAADTTRA